MKIKYFGHSSFLLTESTGTSVITDPYDDRVGYRMPELEADAVTVSHHHYDHDCVSKVRGKPVIFDKEIGCSLGGGVEITSVKSFHDECRGAKRGENIIFRFRMDGLDVCHLGDLGEECSPELIEAILPVNILMIPVGGTYTLDADMAKEYVDRLMPDIVIPMHYRAKGCRLDIDKVDNFLDKFGDETTIVEAGDEIEISRHDLDGEHTKIIVMENSCQ